MKIIHTKIHTFIITLFVPAVAAVVLTASVYAAPACPEPVQVVQPDGTAIEIIIKGDEFLSWYEDADGNLVTFDDDKDGYCYADWTDDGQVSTGELSSPAAARSRKHAKGNNIPKKNLDRAKQVRDKSTPPVFNTAQTRNSLFADTSPLNNASKLQRNVLMIHVTWSDRSSIKDYSGTPMQKMTGDEIYDLVFNPAKNSVNTYYKEVIGSGTDIILPADLGTPMDGKTGVIEVTLPGSHPNPGQNEAGRKSLMINALSAACQGLNLKKYDTNGDNVLKTSELSIGVIIDGFESASVTGTPGFWGSAGTIFAVTVGGVRIESAFGQGAFQTLISNPSIDRLTIGVICHELGHSAYGFTDTYDYGYVTGNKSAGLGDWSLMANGNWGKQSDSERPGRTPSYPDAYNLVKYGFVTPGIPADGETIIINNHNDIYLIRSAVNNKQYFLLQQRKYGSAFNFDRGAFNYTATTANTGGLLIYHVDESVPGNDNYRGQDKPSHYMAGIEEAHGGVQNLQQTNSNKNNGDLGDLWGSGKDVLSRTSDPSSGLYSKYTNDLTPPTQTTASGIEIKDIQWNGANGTTSFTIANPNPGTAPDTDPGTNPGTDPGIEPDIPADSVIVASSTSDDAVINLTAETIHLGGFTVAAYSLDGGAKWKKGALPVEVKFQKLFDKSMTLWVTDKYNTKDVKEGKTVVEKKGVALEATIIKFPQINARPKPNQEKLKPYYLSDTWVLRTKIGGASQSTYEWAETSDKKNPSSEWQTVAEHGFSILSGKTKTVYLFRTPAMANGATYTPGSKAFKLTPANFGKAPNYSIKTDSKTKKKTVKIKANDCYRLGEEEPEKLSAGKDFDVTELTGVLTVWKSETGAKPRTEKQEISLG